MQGGGEDRVPGGVVAAADQPVHALVGWQHTTPGRGGDLGADPGQGPGVKDQRSPGQRRYDAIVEIGRRHLHHPATSSGDGGKAQIRVTIALQSLTDRSSTVCWMTGRRSARP
ncbi:MAG: DUF222 domain-containing protein, partial [Geodermatophilaceae bacterium]|nr:DUF222 domain-containing protein [Geodermatophilaceae bacterium]